MLCDGGVCAGHMRPGGMSAGGVDAGAVRAGAVRAAGALLFGTVLAGDVWWNLDSETEGFVCRTMLYEGSHEVSLCTLVESDCGTNFITA